MTADVSGTYRFVPLEKNHSATLVAGGQIIACLVEFNGGDDIR
jgi:hypothetical protein